MSTPLTKQNDNVLNALNEGRLQGRVEALEEIIKLFQIYFDGADMFALEMRISGLLENARQDYEKWFE
jgi:hypothetical protein